MSGRRRPVLRELVGDVVAEGLAQLLFNIALLPFKLVLQALDGIG